ncbi:MAG: hypothetical protein EBT18_09490 [Gammaproteobacteria bacterium]|nr:hypothetical protein [Gammaproteobacteria bacterium]
MSDTVFVEDVEERKTAREWMAIGKKANSIVNSHLQPILDEIDEEKIPRIVLVLSLFDVAVGGLINHDWSREEILRRVGKHFPQH